MVRHGKILTERGYSCDIDIRKDLYTNNVLSGGTDVSPHRRTSDEGNASALTRFITVFENLLQKSYSDAFFCPPRGPHVPKALTMCCQKTTLWAGIDPPSRNLNIWRPTPFDLTPRGGEVEFFKGLKVFVSPFVLFLPQVFLCLNYYFSRFEVLFIKLCFWAVMTAEMSFRLGSGSFPLWWFVPLFVFFVCWSVHLFSFFFFSGKLEYISLRTEIWGRSTVLVCPASIARFSRGKCPILGIGVFLGD